jgi:hypothetical protein
LDLKAYQIVMIGDERSEEYAYISRESFTPALDKGILEDIITFNAITPDSPDFEEHVSKYTWKTSLMYADLKITGGSDKDDHSPTEKAGMCSHWELMRRQSETDEMFLVMEHDTYLLDVDMFEKCLNVTKDKDLLYTNIGLFMGCYGFEKETARWQYDLLVNREFPINCGPYCTLQRLFATYTTSVLKQNNYRGRGDTFIHPWHKISTLNLGRNVQKPFNLLDPNPKENEWKTPTTQVISKKWGVTQDHHSYKQRHIDNPWERDKNFKVID